MTTGTEIDFDGRYVVEGYSGIAFRLRGYVLEWTEERWEYDGEGDPEDDDSYDYYEPEQVENRQMVEAVMVGDDHVHKVDVEDLTQIDEDAYCHECGQIGCTADGWPRGDQ
jgi:hypothetical protein